MTPQDDPLAPPVAMTEAALMSNIRTPVAVRRFSWQWAKSWPARWIALLIALATYHQWLGARFSNPFFGGDALQYLNLGNRISQNFGDAFVIAAQSKSPISTLIAAAIFRLSGASIVSGMALTSDAYIAYLALVPMLIAGFTGLVALRYTGSQRVGWLALLLAGLYTPFVINSERLLTEAPYAVFLLLTLLCAHEAMARCSVGWSTATGGCFFLTIATRVQYLLPQTALALALLGGVLVVAVWRIVARRADWRSLVAPSVTLIALLGFLALGALIVQPVPPKQRFTGLGDNLILQQSPYAYVLTDGWARDATYLPLPPPDATPLERDVTPLALSGQSLRCSGTDSRTLICLALKSPRFTAVAVARNEFRLWWYPHDDFRVPVGVVTAMMPLYHRSIVALGIVGLLLLAGRLPRAGLLLTPIGFITAVFSMQHIEVRYALPTIPFLIVGASALLVSAWDAVAMRWRAGCGVWRDIRAPRILVPLTLTGSAFVVLLGGQFLFMARGATRAAVLFVRVVPLIVLVGCITAVFARANRAHRFVNAVAVALTAVILTVAVIPALAATPDDWSVTLTDARQQVIQKIILPAAPSGGEEMAVLLDLEALDGDFGDLAITVNGQAVPSVVPGDGAISLTQQQMPYYYDWQFAESHGAHSAANMPQWIAVPIPASWVRAGENDIVLALRPDRPRPHPVRVFGQYSRAASGTLTMPSLFATSLWKTVFDGDARIRQSVTLRPAMRYSLYQEGERASASDLSPERGIQRGTYRIFLGMLSPAQYAARDAPPSAVISAQLARQSPDTPVETFAFAATATPNTRVTLLDDRGTLVVFTPGQGAAQQWRSDRAEIAYTPVYRFGAAGQPPIALDPAASALYRAAPVQAAAPAASEAFGGIYVVRLRQPTRDLVFVVSSRDGPLGTSWANLIPPHGAGTERSVSVDVLLPGMSARNGGNVKAPPVGATSPAFFMLHGGDVRADALVAQAAVALRVPTPETRFLPVTAPQMREDRTTDGSLYSFWAVPDTNAEQTRATVAITLA